MVLCGGEFAEGNAVVHTDRGMDIPKILQGIATRASVKQTGLASLIGVTQPQISRYMRGAEPKQQQFQKIIDAARRFGVIEEGATMDAQPEPPQPRLIKVKGYVGAGGRAHYYAVAQGDLDEIDAAEKDGPNAVAVQIIGSSLGRFFNGWYVVYEDVRRPVTDDLIGQLCVVGLSDDRVLVKKIKRAGRGRFDLISNEETEPTIESVQIEWAAKVSAIRDR